VQANIQAITQAYTQTNKAQAMEFKCEAISLILENIPSATTKSYETRNAYGGVLMQRFLEKYIFKSVVQIINS
jgi:hypothetical protein